MRFYLSRVVQLVVVLLVVTFLTYFLTFSLQGDVVSILLQGEAGSETRRAEITEELNLDDSLPVRYGKWAGDAMTGDLGSSFVTNQPVSQLIRTRLPRTLALVIYSQIIALIIAVPLGILAAYKAGSFVDKSVNVMAFSFLSLPDFVAAPMLVALFSVGVFHWFSASVPNDLSVFDLKNYFLPALAIALGQVAVYLRLLRTDMIATLQEDFIGMAKSKGLSTRHVLFRHALRPSSLSLLTVMGITFGQALAGSVVVEYFFQMPGMGYLLVQAIFQRDLLVIQAVVVVLAVGFVVVNFLIDVVYSMLDPRIRHARAG